MATLDATDKATVKTIIGKTDAGDDATLDAMIAAVSDEIEVELDTDLLQATKTEEYDVADRQRLFFLRKYPVASITTVKSRSDWDWASASALDSALYHLRPNSRRLYIEAGLVSGPGTLQVVYVGGFDTTVALILSNFPSISMAANIAVVAMWRKRKDPLKVGVSQAGAKIDWQSELVLPKRSLQLLARWKLPII